METNQAENQKETGHSPSGPQVDDYTDLATKEEFVRAIQDNLLVSNYDQADKALAEFKNRLGEVAEYLHSEALLHRKRGDLTKAYQVLKRLYFEHPVYMGDNWEYETLRDSYLLEKIEKAKVHWNCLINLNSRLLSLESGNPTEFEAQRDSLQTDVDGEMKCVVDAYKEVLTIEPMQLTAIKGLAYCFNELGDTDFADNMKDRLEKAEKYWGDMIQKRSHICMGLAKKMYGEKHHAEAISVINLGLVTSPNHRDLLLLKVEILRDLKRFRDASAIVEMVLRKYQNDSGALRLRKEILSGRMEETLNIGLLKLQEAEQKLPGCDLQKLSREALESFYEVLDYEPESLKTLIAVYRCHVLMENPIKARKTLSRIREIDPAIDLERKVAPRVVGNPHESDEEPCFVATRLFGKDHPATCRLRKFRDQQLLKHRMGKVFVRLYRRVGPSMAALPGVSPLFPGIRVFLKALVRLLD